MKDKTTITVERDTSKNLQIIKIHTNAKNVDNVIRSLIKNQKKKVKK